ncbi:uncharacterized protein PGTG_01215 [Puccinia graminis f. sp. tritici CRL 75-36-700-3]|uniref:GH26 domain-containing protein n=1 Tax=Puccinia graminis f. sp. tritici (strain CRL 75-36-700-3 / race SCCL) TaxID=418459 RepID=E3JV09_PUCGT|nr:uncharacterized protein PGTG_01215 [Puccinia graminis f. sp. tritici CRL 75-36-700-3]EFP75884.1 hypothetical protein PGTG_01215 [Puccinia graminis f. sp. tritici CRL 75-36-700-3]
MGSHLLAPLQRKIIGLFCLVLFAQSLVAVPDASYHNYKSTPKNSHQVIKSRGQNLRQTKFSYLGPAGIRAHDSLTAKIDGVYIGLIPDAGDTGGNVQTMREIIKSINGKRPAVFGWYAQVSVHKEFDGSQLFEILDDLKKSKCVFSPAIMPQGGWAGLRRGDNHQAVAIAKVLRKFTDQEIPVILRFAHEVNWYQRTHEYPGNAADFKEAWAVLAAAIREHAPDVLLHWCPNVSTMEEYRKYAPDNMDYTVDIVGFDYYPKSKPQPDEFVKKAKEFHDAFAINGRKFAMGEAGLHYQASYKDRVDWLSQMAHARKELPNLLFINWYNSKKEYDYKIAGNGLSTTLLTEKLE